MTHEDKIIHYLHELPEAKKVEVLDFVEYLRSKTEEEEWSALSLFSATRGIAEEPAPYSLADLTESWETVK